MACSMARCPAARALNLKKGDLIAMMAIGAGMAWGCPSRFSKSCSAVIQTSGTA
jgi:hypothetical protein